MDSCTFALKYPPKAPIHPSLVSPPMYHHTMSLNGWALSMWYVGTRALQYRSVTGIG